MRIFWICLTVLIWASAALAQEDDRGFLTRTLEEALTDAGRDVRIDGFSGALSSQASFDQLTIADDSGIWLTLKDVVLDWNRGALLRGRVEVRTLSAASLEIARLPQQEADTVPAAEASGFTLPDLPVSIDIEQFQVGQIILGELVLGEPVQLQVEASAKLGDGAGQAQILASRTDQKQGRFEISSRLERDGNTLTLKLNVSEGPDGIAARLLNVPGRPAVALTVDGDGPLDDFVAEITLETDGEPRLSGQVKLKSETTNGQTVRLIGADLGGDVTALFAPEFQPFFGRDAGLQLEARQDADGALDVSRFSLDAQSAQLRGQLRLNPDQWPTFLEIDGTIVDRAGQSVLLPVAGADTRVRKVDLSLRYDAAVSEDWTGVFDLRDLERPDISVQQARLDFTGTLQGNMNSVGQVLADVALSAKGLSPKDQKSAAALGPELNGAASLNYIEGQPLRVSDLQLNGADYGLSGWVIIDGLDSGLNTRMDLAVEADDLSRFAPLAGQDIAGAAKVEVAGTYAPLGGTFDLEVDGTGRELKVAQTQADRLLKGITRLNIAARRTVEGTEISKLVLSNPAIQLDADARLKSANSDVNFDARLTDVAVIAPQVPGALHIKGTARQNGQDWTIDTSGTGPYSSRFSVTGVATGPDAALGFEARLPDLRVFVPQIAGPLEISGDVRKSDGGWAIETIANGPSGTQANVAGLVKDDGRVNMKATGNAPLGLAGPFIKPRSLLGQATFDLALNGQPALSSLSGRISTSGARFSAPNLRLALTDIASNIDLNGSTATTSLNALVTSGGRITASGPIQLSGNYPANLNVAFIDTVLQDPALFRTVLNGALAVNGPLTGGANISGRIDVGQTDITVPSTGLTGIGDIPEITHVGAPRGVQITRARAGLLKSGSDNGAANGPSYGLNINVRAPNKIFVRGRGVDAELGGQLAVTGTTNNVISAGRFDLIRGRLDILGQRFALDEGSIQLQGGLVPFIRFVSSTDTRAGTASVVIEGPADRPEVTFRSTPEAPQDEVLAQLLFGRDLSQISAFQALRLASAVATLAGKGGLGVIGQLRQGFGLDDLDITTNDDGTTAVRAGKYISDNVYTDVTAGSNGTGEVSLNLDLSPSVTAKGTVGSDGNSSVGLFFQRDY